MAASNPREIVWISFGILAWIQSKWSLWRRVGASENEWATKCCKTKTKHNHLHRMRSENISRNVTQISGCVYQTTPKANRRKTNHGRNKMLRPEQLEEMTQENRQNLWTRIYEQSIKQKRNWAAGGVLTVGVSPPHNGPPLWEVCASEPFLRMNVWTWGRGCGAYLRNL